LPRSRDWLMPRLARPPVSLVFFFFFLFFFFLFLCFFLSISSSSSTPSISFFSSSSSSPSHRLTHSPFHRPYVGGVQRSSTASAAMDLLTNIANRLSTPRPASPPTAAAVISHSEIVWQHPRGHGQSSTVRKHRAEAPRGYLGVLAAVRLCRSNGRQSAGGSVLAASTHKLPLYEWLQFQRLAWHSYRCLHALAPIATAHTQS
jgi:hypothetical protein